ncbi:LysR substrate-binding domain-containing protein [Bordetella sp. BOR01]|uniref:LysR substrate-binding domain-containing protein n=1 Tax=Bordetella sp. BOR01 TaxID=2854779 RepID=UPI001C48F26F|nr:LysR substrate-binding domain-containing protein [Bordetella sp. BOR01]MBV7486511.1 LysR family transcriptional regulator [Bordetella sp. BOR01]
MRYRLPPLNTLRIFEAIMRRGSIRQAAEELCLTPQAVSQQLKQLEAHLEQPLFQRNIRSLTPTQAANTLHAHVQGGLDRFADGVNAIQTSRATQQLYLYVSPYFATEFLVPKLGNFTASHPNIDFRMAVGVDLVELDERGMDAAIHWDYGGNTEYVETPLIDDLKVLVATPGLLERLPLRTPADLLKHSVVTSLVANTLWDDTLDLLGVPERASQPLLLLHTHAAMMEAVLAGLGVGFISYADAVREVGAGRLVSPYGMDLLKQLPAKKMPRFSLLIKPDRKNSPLLQQFARWLLDYVCAEAVVGYASQCRQEPASTALRERAALA